MLRRVLMIAVLLPIFATCFAAEDSFNIETFIQVPVLRTPLLSPDGGQVAYTILQRDLENDEYVRQLWLADVETGEKRRITFDGASTGSLRWHPAGYLSFLRSHDGQKQIWINLLDGSEPRPVTDMPNGVGSFWWAPDGRTVAA
jgi:Tol biopolymer transport system component